MTTSEFTISGWEVESFRATTFHPLDSRIFERASLWQDVVGTSPQSIDSRPREGVSQHAGELDDRQLVLIARNDRADWILRPHRNHQPRRRSFPPWVTLLLHSSPSVELSALG